MKSVLRLKEPLDLLFAEDPDGSVKLAEWKLMQEVEVVTKAWEESLTMNGVLEQIYPEGGAPGRRQQVHEHQGAG